MADGFRYDLIPPGTKVLCALSGGADSMYLLCRLLSLLWQHLHHLWILQKVQLLRHMSR